MRPLTVTFAPQARSDIGQIHEWLAERSANAATGVITSIRETSQLIGEYPMIGRVTEFAGVRVLPVIRYPYLVYYLVEAHEVVIVHVRHGARAAPESRELG